MSGRQNLNYLILLFIKLNEIKLNQKFPKINNLILDRYSLHWPNDTS